MVPSLITAACLILSCITTLASGQVQLKVGLYNAIPDLQGDGPCHAEGNGGGRFQ